MIALNAESIVAARMRGMKPADMIRVSLVGALPPGNHAVLANPAVLHDWRWVRDLDVCLCINSDQDWPATMKAIALDRPEFLNVWFVDLSAGAKVYLVPTLDDVDCRPVSKWEYELDFLSWMDFQNEDFLANRHYCRMPSGMPARLAEREDSRCS